MGNIRSGPKRVRLNSTGAPQNITGAGTLTSNSIVCRGARAVHFIIRSTTDADTFAAAGAFNLRYQIDSDAAVSEGTGPPGVAVVGSLNGIVGNTGAIITICPVTNGPNARLACHSIGTRIVAGAAAIDNVYIDAYVVWD